MAFKQCNPGDKNAYGYIWVCGEQHDIVDVESVNIMMTHEKATDKGAGRISLDKSTSAFIEVTFRRLPAHPPSDYEVIRCCTVQYQDKNFLYTINEAAFEAEPYQPGDGEKISGKFICKDPKGISYIPVSNS